MQDKYLEPKTGISDLDIWQQCYHRWIPILEIKHGGFPQIDLFHRLILSNISKLQRAIETGDFDDLPDNIIKLSPTKMKATKLSTSSTSSSSLSSSNDITPTNSPSKQMPIVHSFFPFSANINDSSQLNDILTNSNELLTDGSIMDRLSIAQLPD